MITFVNLKIGQKKKFYETIVQGKFDKSDCIKIRLWSKTMKNTQLRDEGYTHMYTQVEQYT